MVAGSEDEETMVTCRKPAKITHHLIQAAHTIKAMQPEVSKTVKAPATKVPAASVPSSNRRECKPIYYPG